MPIPSQVMAEFEQPKSWTDTRTLALRFRDLAMELIWMYSPDVKLRELSDIKFHYTYLLPGATRIPAVSLITQNGDSILIHVEADHVPSLEETVLPDPVWIKKIGLVFEMGEKRDTVMLEFNDENSLVSATLPPASDLFIAARVCDYIRDRHLALGTERAPDGL